MSQTLHQTKLRALVRATARRYLRASVRALLSYARARSRRVARATAELRVLEQLLPTENGITVFDAENQATSYGIWFLDDLPFIFDTHRKDGRYVATIELLTEVVTPVRIPPARVCRFGAACRDLGLLPLPYSAATSKTTSTCTRSPVQSEGSTSSPPVDRSRPRSEEHTSELQSRENRVCPPLLEK